MNIRELRKTYNITQLKASEILNVPLRTYIRYESEEKYRNTLKYQKMYDVLQDFLKVDEEHGVLTIEEIKKEAKKVFDKYNIELAFIFGSYAKHSATPKSDIDIMISSDITGLDYFGLVEELRQTLHKKIDLVRLKDIVQGSQLMIEILKVCIKIYG